MDINNPPEAYFEAMRRLMPEPPDEETVERIVDIFREWCRKQERLESKKTGGSPPVGGP